MVVVSIIDEGGNVDDHPAATLGAYGLPVFHQPCPVCGMPCPGGAHSWCAPQKFEPLHFDPPKFEPLHFDPPKFEPLHFDPPKFEPLHFDPPKFEPLHFDSPKFEPLHFDSPKLEPLRFDPPNPYFKSERTCIHGNTGYCILCSLGK
jgi:hypothetical protein